MPFLIVDNPLVVKLRCPKSQLVIGIRGSHDKTVCLQEGFHQFVFIRGSLPKFKLTRAVVQAGTELLQSPVDSEFLRCRSTLWDQGRRSSLRLDTSRPKMSLQLLKRARPHCL